jgi:hypothetical protein
MSALALMLGPTRDGGAVYLSNGREVRRFRGLWARRKPLRFIRRVSSRDLLGGPRWTRKAPSRTAVRASKTSVRTTANR